MTESSFQTQPTLSVEKQIKRLKNYFPSAKFQVTGSDNQGFVILNWESLSSDYVKAVDKVLKKLSEVHKGFNFKNMYQGKFVSENFRQTTETAKAFEKIMLAQNNKNCVIIPANLGASFVGESVNDALLKIDTSSEFGLSFFHIALIILTHYERIVPGSALWINCAGDEMINTESKKGEFDCAPLICVKPKEISMCSHQRNQKFAFSGIAVGSYVNVLATV